MTAPIEADQLLAGDFPSPDDLFGYEFAIWAPSDAGWSPVSHCPTQWLPPADLLDRCVDEQQPLAVNHGENEALLLIPLAPWGVGSGVALAVIPEPPHRFLVDWAIARLDWLAEHQQRRETDLILDSLSEQFSDSLEELTLMRNAMGQLAYIDHDADVRETANEMLPLYHYPLNAEFVGFYPEESICSPETLRGMPWIISAVDDFDPIFARQIIIDNADPEKSLQVRNNVDKSDDRERYPGIQNWILSRVFHKEKSWGYMIALNRVGSSFAKHGPDREGEVGTHEATLLATASSLLATHASNVAYHHEKEQLLINLIRTLVYAIEAKDAYTCGHSERVALYSARLASHLGYSEYRRQRLYLSGLLHDIGKIAISDSALKKPGKLTDEEYMELKQHPDAGWTILQELTQLEDVLPGVLHHHERWDGKGYPDGLAGEEIPLDARIMSVADAYDAMTSDRPYRNGMPHDNAESIIREGAGTQWDAQVVEVFLRIRDEILLIKRTYHPKEKVPRKQPALAATALDTETTRVASGI